MVVKHCVYKDCESDSRYWDRDYMKGVCFIRFPNPVTHRQRCQKWVMACDRPNQLTIDLVTDKTFICSKHFVGGNGPTVDNADPLSPQQMIAINSSTSIDTNTTLQRPPNNDQHFVGNKLSTNLLQTTTTSCESQLMTKLLNNNNNKSLQMIANDSQSSRVVNQSTTTVSSRGGGESSSSSLLSYNNNNNRQQNGIRSINENTGRNHQEVLNNSLPLIIIPSATNPVIGSTFSVPIGSINDTKNWFTNVMNSEFYRKLSLLGLSVGLVSGQHRLTFSDIEATVVRKQLIVDKSGCFDVKVFGLSIGARNQFYKLVPNLISSDNEFQSTLELFAKWRVCYGNDNDDNKILEDQVIAIRSFICNLTNRIRHRHCCLFLPEVGSIRCKFCRLLLNRIRKSRYNINNNNINNNNNNTLKSQSL